MTSRSHSLVRRGFAGAFGAATLLLGAAPAAAQDPRVGLKAGVHDAGEAIRNLTLVSHTPKQDGWFNPRMLGDFAFANSDLAFQKHLVFQGGWHGWQAWDISNPKAPKLRKAFVCQGGQGDLSVHGTLLFMSVEDNVGRVDCGTQGVSDSVSTARFSGVRIFDISDLRPAAPGGGRADVPRLAHAHAGPQPEGSLEDLRLRLRHGRRAVGRGA